ncbi:hypothetical protein PCANC_23734 [Puccinia coronata f. sp. avenae]|uniref:Uncharacterized protein n=1 Tax=Puccinia coronata f. sp. avenae TaxID=200324 RepID=A0A2N5SC31_9BASI|nr:hypothetical protein PCANC_23734 [Puccinia coronata f. sp. avenae]
MNVKNIKKGVDKKTPVKPRLHAVLPGGDVVAPGERLVPARRGITPRRAGTRLYQPAEKLFLGEQVQAGTCLPRDNSSTSCYKLVPARRGVISRQAGTGFDLLGEE